LAHVSARIGGLPMKVLAFPDVTCQNVKTNMAQDKLVTKSEAARKLGVARRTVIRYCQRFSDITVDGKVRLGSLVDAIVNQQRHEARGYPLQRSRHSSAGMWQGKPLAKKLHRNMERTRRLACIVARGPRRSEDWRLVALSHDLADKFEHKRITVGQSWKNWSVAELQDIVDEFACNIDKMISFIEPLQKFLVEKKQE
jgi:hypothetical protein